MKGTLAAKLLESHLLEGKMETGETITIKINQTLTQDSTGTMVYLQLLALDVDRIQTDLSVAYIDHNILQIGFENADDHAFIRSCAEKYGIIFSKPGGGICHQVHLERFGKPGATLLGSDSHTPTDGGLGALAIGAGGLDVAVAMATGTFNIRVPEILNIHLTGSLKAGVNAKDVILEILRQITVKGGVGKILEYSGPGVKNLDVTDRATICNMGAESGATASIFPSDENTLKFLTRQGRAKDYIPLEADPDAEYEEVLEIDLSEIVPMIALPSNPDKVVRVKDVEGEPLDQICIGSCTNSSFTDIMKAAAILDGHRAWPSLDLTLTPGSSHVLRLISENGALTSFLKAGARILECACGPCIGMGQAPKSGGKSLRTFNRNFRGRSGTTDAGIYLASPETAAASAINGVITDPRRYAQDLDVEIPNVFELSTSYLIIPKKLSEPSEKPVRILRGPNIKPFPLGQALEDSLTMKVLFQAGDNVTTDDICPSNAKLLPFRSNVPYLSNYMFKTLIPDFPVRAKEHDGGFIAGGENYGQGSSREHAAFVSLYLGVRAVFAKSFARIHRTNLINSGILPLVFDNPEDYKLFTEGATVKLTGLQEAFENLTLIHAFVNGKDVIFRHECNAIEGQVLLEGGYINYIKAHQEYFDRIMSEEPR